MDFFHFTGGSLPILLVLLLVFVGLIGRRNRFVARRAECDTCADARFQRIRPLVSKVSLAMPRDGNESNQP